MSTKPCALYCCVFSALPFFFFFLITFLFSLCVCVLFVLFCFAGGWRRKFYLLVYFFLTSLFCLANEKVEDINGCPRSQSQMVRKKYIFSLCWHFYSFLKCFLKIYLSCAYSVPYLTYSPNSYILFLELVFHTYTLCLYLHFCVS